MAFGRRLRNRQHMALADIPVGTSRRLDSWKEIAEYLRRDVRTATRWESQGLPLHRVPGGKGRSVFAFTHEIDAWLAGRSAEPAAEGLPTDAANPSFRLLILTGVFVAALIGVGAVVMSSGAARSHVPAELEVEATSSRISVTDASGVSRVLHRFDPGAVLTLGVPVRTEDLDADGMPEVLATVSYYDNQDGLPIRSGEFIDLAASGRVRWKFAFDDVMTFAGRDVSGPWALTDWQVGPAGPQRRVALAAHEATWWASIVAVLDHTGKRLGAFVNPGWIESLIWPTTDRLVIAGFNNMRDEAAFAVLDASRIGGQAPGTDGTAFACLTCPKAPPLFYATFSRSEVNRATVSRFNRARVAMAGDQILVTTVEVDRENGGDASAIYEFDRDLRFVRARYSDTYWDEHRRLEGEGRLTHSRDLCPDRDGPAAIHLWDAARGWVRTLPSGGS